MGLDISFSLARATEAGLQLTKDTNGTEEEIATAKAEQYGDDGYIAWLAETIDILHVPDTDLLVRADIFEDQISVRANKWGKAYTPLTQWLTDNNIEWGEW